LTTSTQTGDRHWDAELHRLKGELLMLKDRDRHLTEAEGQIRKAIEVSCKQEAKALELRSVTSLASVLQSQNRPSEARSALRPVYEWFSEGHEFPDLISAKALLDKLQGK
jgi:predicted ATPase